LIEAIGRISEKNQRIRRVKLYLDGEIGHFVAPLS